PPRRPPLSLLTNVRTVRLHQKGRATPRRLAARAGVDAQPLYAAGAIIHRRVGTRLCVAGMSATRDRGCILDWRYAASFQGVQTGGGGGGGGSGCDLAGALFGGDGRGRLRLLLIWIIRCVPETPADGSKQRLRSALRPRYPNNPHAADIPAGSARRMSRGK